MTWKKDIWESTKSVTRDINDSFKTGTGGYSSRKSSAFVGIMTAIWCTINYTDKDSLVEVLIIWLSFALICFGIVTVTDIIKFKNGTVVQEEVKVTQKTTKVTGGETEVL